MSYAPANFEVAMAYRLGDTITRNTTNAHTDGQTDGLWYEIDIPFFFFKIKGGIIRPIHRTFYLTMQDSNQPTWLYKLASSRTLKTFMAANNIGTDKPAQIRLMCSLVIFR